MENELLKLDSKTLKNYFKNKNEENPMGYWKMGKKDMVEEIIKYEEKIKDEIKDEPKVKKIKKVKKYIYKVFDPEGNLKLEVDNLKDVVDYSTTNGICSRGWVNLSIRRNIPVLIGLGYDSEISEDFVPRVTKKYSGNYWKFTKEISESEVI